MMDSKVLTASWEPSTLKPLGEVLTLLDFWASTASRGPSTLKLQVPHHWHHAPVVSTTPQEPSMLRCLEWHPRTYDLRHLNGSSGTVHIEGGSRRFCVQVRAGVSTSPPGVVHVEGLHGRRGQCPRHGLSGSSRAVHIEALGACFSRWPP